MKQIGKSLLLAPDLFLSRFEGVWKERTALIDESAHLRPLHASSLGIYHRHNMVRNSHGTAQIHAAFVVHPARPRSILSTTSCEIRFLVFAPSYHRDQSPKDAQCQKYQRSLGQNGGYGQAKMANDNLNKS